MISLPNLEPAFVDHYHTGHQHMQQGNIQGAIKSWNQVLVLRPDHVDALENRSIARRLIGDLRGALEDVNEVIALDPFRSLPYWIRGEIYGFQGQFEQAIADFEYLLTLQSSKIPRERIITSLEHWRRMQALQPASHKPVVVEPLSPKPAQTKPIVTEPNTADPNTADPNMAEAVSLESTLPKPTSFELVSSPPSSPMSTEIVSTYQPEQQITYAPQLKSDFLAKSDPQIKVIEFSTTGNRKNRNAPQQAESHAYDDEIIDVPYRILSPLDFVYKARELVSGGNYRAALQELTTAIEMDPTLIDAYVERGSTYVALGATVQAQLDLDRALTLNPHDPGALVNRANVELLNGAAANAIPLLQKVFESAPQYAPLHATYGSFCEAEGNYAVAFAAYDCALRLDPNSASAFFNRGRMYMKYQMARQALADFSRTLELQPNHARSYFSIGGIYAVRGDYEIAQYYYQQAAQLGYEAAQLALRKLQQAEPVQHQPTPIDQWQSDSLDLLAQALIDIATFAYNHSGPCQWQETVRKKALLGLSTKSTIETIRRWQVELQTVNEIDQYGINRTMQAAVLILHQSPEVAIRVLPISSHSYALSIWAHRSIPGMRNTVFTSGLKDYLTVVWSELPGILMELLRTHALELRGAQLYYTGKPIHHLSNS